MAPIGADHAAIAIGDTQRKPLLHPTVIRKGAALLWFFQFNWYRLGFVQWRPLAHKIPALRKCLSFLLNGQS
jgi:hypothetical protein